MCWCCAIIDSPTQALKDASSGYALCALNAPIGSRDSKGKKAYFLLKRGTFFFLQNIGKESYLIYFQRGE